MKPITRWELIKAIAEAYKLYYLDPDPTALPISIVYDRYGLNTSIRPKEQLSEDEHFILAIKPGFIGIEVETIDDIYTWFIDYAIRDIDDYINELGSG